MNMNLPQVNMGLWGRLHWVTAYADRASRCFNTCRAFTITRNAAADTDYSRYATDMRDTAYTLADVAAYLARPC